MQVEAWPYGGHQEASIFMRRTRRRGLTKRVYNGMPHIFDARLGTLCQTNMEPEMGSFVGFRPL